MTNEKAKQTKRKSKITYVLSCITAVLWAASLIMVLELITDLAQKIGHKLSLRFLVSFHDYCVSLGQNIAIAFVVLSVALLAYFLPQKKLIAAMRESMRIKEEFTALKAGTDRQVKLHIKDTDDGIKKINEGLSEIGLSQVKLSERVRLNAGIHRAHEKMLLVKVTRCHMCLNTIAENTDLEYRVRGLADEEQTMLSELEAIVE